MTNKINGIDVSECSYYIQDYQRANNIEGRYEHCKDVCELNGDNYFYCKMNKDCYFKQLKRLQGENEKLKKRQITKNGFICDCEQNEKYKQALEEIREITEQDRNCMNSELACCRLCDKLDLIKEKINEVLNDRN